MRLATRTIGAGSRAMAMVHGVSASGEVLIELAELIAARFDATITLVDLRGHGDSPTDSEYPLTAFADDLVETLPVGLDRIIGHSLGGRAAADAADRLRPERLILLDPGFTLDRRAGLFFVYVLPWLTRSPHWVQWLINVPPRRTSAVSKVRVRHAWAQWDRRVIGAIAAVGSDKPLGPPVVPSTMVLAQPSFVVPKKWAAAVADLGWEVRVKRHAVHDMHLEDPAGVVEAVADRLAATG